MATSVEILPRPYDRECDRDGTPTVLSRHVMEISTRDYATDLLRR
jgi:hypothetical protein